MASERDRVEVGEYSDLLSARDTVAEAGGVSNALWLSYMLSMFYLLVAAAGVTQQDLLLENPVKLPFLGIELRLEEFFVLGPLLFIVVHAYILMHFALLADKTGFLMDYLNRVSEHKLREHVLKSLPDNIFIKYLTNSDRESSAFRIILWITVLSTLVFMPLCLLIFFQLQFLAFHSEFVTWWQRIMLFIDLALLWLLWPPPPRNRPSTPAIRLATLIIAVVLSLAPIAFATSVAVFPGEWLYTRLPQTGRLQWLRQEIVEGNVNPDKRKPASYWSNRIVLPGFDSIDHSKFDSEVKINAVTSIANLRARHLERAILTGANLRKADFAGAWLQGADLSRADLRSANFSCLAFPCTHLQGANFTFAQLEEADFDSADLQATLLVAAHLDGASLQYALLQAANLAGAMLNLTLLNGAQMQGVSATNTQFKGAVLDDANLEAADLDDAKFQAASLMRTRLQGARLNNANFDDAWLESVLVWRVNPGTAQLKNAVVIDPTIETDISCKDSQSPSCLDDPSQLHNNDAIMLYNSATDRVHRRLQNRDDPDGAKWAAEWLKLNSSDQTASSTFLQSYGKQVEALVESVACTFEGAPSLRRLLNWYEDPETLSAPIGDPRATALRPNWPQMAKTFLDSENCAGNFSLSALDKARLREMRGTGSSTQADTTAATLKWCHEFPVAEQTAMVPVGSKRDQLGLSFGRDPRPPVPRGKRTYLARLAM